MEEIDESGDSEITILPDGRVYAFGITRSIAEILKDLQSREGALRHEKVVKTAVVANSCNGRKEQCNG